MAETNYSGTKIMRYALRAVKYFIYLCVLVAIMIGILIAVGYAEADINSLFKKGYESLLMIAVMFAALSAIYPLFGFMKKSVIIPGEYSEIRDTVVNTMNERGYDLESEEGENMTFRKRGSAARLLKMFEDRITLERDITGFRMEGLRKDVVRLGYAIENKARQENI